jgi:predicted nuclease with TOPRIM domain
LEDTTAGLEESKESSDLLKEELKEIREKFEAEKIEVEKTLLKKIEELSNQRDILNEKDLIVFHLENENFSMREMLSEKEKEIKKMKKILSRLEEDVEDFRSLNSKCEMLANIVHEE